MVYITLCDMSAVPGIIELLFPESPPRKTISKRYPIDIGSTWRDRGDSCPRREANAELRPGGRALELRRAPGRRSVANLEAKRIARWFDGDA